MAPASSSDLDIDLLVLLLHDYGARHPKRAGAPGKLQRAWWPRGEAGRLPLFARTGPQPARDVPQAGRAQTLFLSHERVIAQVLAPEEGDGFDAEEEILLAPRLAGGVAAGGLCAAAAVATTTTTAAAAPKPTPKPPALVTQLPRFAHTFSSVPSVPFVPAERATPIAAANTPDPDLMYALQLQRELDEQDLRERELRLAADAAFAQALVAPQAQSELALSAQEQLGYARALLESSGGLQTPHDSHLSAKNVQSDEELARELQQGLDWEAESRRQAMEAGDKYLAEQMQRSASEPDPGDADAMLLDMLSREDQAAVDSWDASMALQLQLLEQDAPEKQMQPDVLALMEMFPEADGHELEETLQQCAFDREAAAVRLLAKSSDFPSLGQALKPRQAPRQPTAAWTGAKPTDSGPLLGPLPVMKARFPNLSEASLASALRRAEGYMSKAEDILLKEQPDVYLKALFFSNPRRSHQAAAASAAGAAQEQRPRFDYSPADLMQAFEHWGGFDAATQKSMLDSSQNYDAFRLDAIRFGDEYFRTLKKRSELNQAGRIREASELDGSIAAFKASKAQAHRDAADALFVLHNLELGRLIRRCNADERPPLTAPVVHFRLQESLH